MEEHVSFPSHITRALEDSAAAQDPEAVKRDIRAKSEERSQAIKRRVPQQHTPLAVPVSPVSAAVAGLSPAPHQSMPQTVAAVPQPTVGLSSDPEAISLALPSNFHYYQDFKDVYCKPFRALHLSKLSRAQAETSLLHTVEAVNSVLSSTTSVPNIAFKLGTADFYAVLYWLKFNSFTKSTLNHRAICKNPSHHHAIKNGELDVSTLVTQLVVTQTQLETKYLKSPLVASLPGYRLRPATMKDTVEYFEHPEWNLADFQFLADLASVMEPLHDPDMSLYEKIELVKQLSGDDVAIVEEFSRQADSFGVMESVNVTCGGCGASFESKISIDARSFLPSAQ